MPDADGRRSGKEEIQRMTIEKFVELGLLQELNRRALHPLGLALEVRVEPDGSMALGGIWDYRDDDEGVVFASEASRPGAVANWDNLVERHRAAREARFGSVIQPTFEDPEEFERANAPSA